MFSLDRMGILSDPEYGSAKWVKILKRIKNPLCFFCYVGALVWFLILGHREFNNETYFSENALLPGLVTNEFNGEQSAKQFFKEFLQELEVKYKDTTAMPVPWLVGKMSQLHMEVYTHNFTLHYPLGQGQVFKGTNVYGILRAPRTPSLEAIVVSAPYRPLSSHEKSTAAGIALMLAFAQFARPQKYWAKDIIFLITEHEQLGMQAWLEAYHGLQSDTETFYTSLGSFWKPGTMGKKFEPQLADFGWKNSQKCLNPGKLRGRSGAIQAAINLEIHDPKIKYIEVKVEGLNGQLPNLDLVNLVHKLCVKSSIHHSYKYSYSWIRNYNHIDEWKNNLWTMVGMVSAQLAGVPNGNHGLFHRFGIEAVTLEGRDANDPAGIPPKVHSLSPANFYRLGTALESILRSLNNLLERFHQSYFFYLLANTNRFISIGQYMPSLCLLCLAMLIKALTLWVTIQEDDEDDTQTDAPNVKKRKSSESDVSETKKRKRSESDVPGNQDDEDVKSQKGLRRRRKSEAESEVPGDDEVKEVSKKKKGQKKRNKLEASNMSTVNIGGNYLLVHFIGYAVMNSPPLLTHLGVKYFKLQSEVSVYYGLISTSVLLVLLSPYLPRLLRTGRMSREEMSLVNILALIELSTLCLTIGMHNFPLGLVIATLYTPLALVAGVVVRGKGRRRSMILFLKRALCLLVHPLSIVSLSMVVYSRVLVPEEAILSTMNRGVDAATKAIMFSIIDSLIYGNWLFSVVTSMLFPTWIIFWQILCNKVDA